MQSSALEPLGLGRAHFFLVSRLTFLIIYFGLPCVRTRSWKMLVIKPRGEGEQWLECSPVAPCRQPLQSRPACLYLKRKRGRLSPPLPLLMIFFFFLFFSSGDRGGLLPERADVRQRHTAKPHSSWGENLLWIKPRPQSGLVLILLLCAQSNWRGPDYRRYLWRLTAIWSQHSDTTFGANWVYLDYKLQLDCTKAEPLLAIMSNFTLNQRVMLETCLCSSKAQRPNYSGPWKWLMDCVCLWAYC